MKINKTMTSLELLREIDAWLSFNNSPSKEQISELRKDIKKHLTEQLKCEHKGRRTATELVEYCEDCKKILFHP